MRLELEEHFVQAALDGKALEAVIGPNPPAFAEGWAREMRPRIVRGGSVIIPSLVYAFSIVGTSALAQQWLTHTPSFTLTMLTVYLLVSSGVLALLMPLEGFLAAHSDPVRSPGVPGNRDARELEYGTPQLELASHHALARSGGNPLLPADLAGNAPKANRRCSSQRAADALGLAVRCQGSGI